MCCNGSSDCRLRKITVGYGPILSKFTCTEGLWKLSSLHHINWDSNAKNFCKASNLKFWFFNFVNTVIWNGILLNFNNIEFVEKIVFIFNSKCMLYYECCYIVMFISDHTFPLIVIVLSVISNAAHFACKIDQVRFYIELLI